MKIHKTTFDELAGKSVTDLARKLIKEGNDLDDQIEVYRGDRVDLRITNIGKAASVTVKEDDKDGPRFVRYREKPSFLYDKTAQEALPA